MAPLVSLLFISSTKEEKERNQWDWLKWVCLLRREAPAYNPAIQKYSRSQPTLQSRWAAMNKSIQQVDWFFSFAFHWIEWVYYNSNYMTIIYKYKFML